MSVAVRKRPLTEEEISRIVADTKRFPDLVYIRPYLWKTAAHAYCLFVRGEFAGACLAYSFRRWTKLGPLVVLRHHQGKGHGKTLLRAVVRDHRHRNMFLSSSSPAVAHIADALGFQRVPSYFSLPVRVRMFLAYHLVELIDATFIVESARKLVSLKRDGRKYFVKRADR